MSNQPKWKLVAQLGDVNYLEYGGYFVYVDTTGHYPPVAEFLDLNKPYEEKSGYTVYQITLKPCTYIDGVLSDNPYHPEHPAWFASAGGLQGLGSYIGASTDELVALLTSDDPLDRAAIWRAIGEYHGFANLNEYPLTLTRGEANKRYGLAMNALKKRRRSQA